MNFLIRIFFSVFYCIHSVNSQVPSEIFNIIGENSFADKQVPQGLTRQEWYEQMLYDQEMHIKKNLLYNLGIDLVAFENYLQIAKRKIDCWDAYEKSQQISIIGN